MKSEYYTVTVHAIQTQAKLIQATSEKEAKEKAEKDPTVVTVLRVDKNGHEV